MTGASDYVCDHPGCDVSPATGGALLRTSPKGPGQKFVGLCPEHYRQEFDEMIEDLERS